MGDAGMSAIDAIMPYEPIEHCLDLPMPTPVNRLWRSGRGRVYKSAEYNKWILAADQVVRASKIMRGARKINGPFEATLFLNSDNARGDADGRIKAPLDYVQSLGLISDDKFARRVTVEWVQPSKAPLGCRVIIKELAG